MQLTSFGAGRSNLICREVLLLAVCVLYFCQSAVAATRTVSNTNDNLAGSLRQNIQDAAAGDTIAFNIPTSDPGYDATARSFTITLNAGRLLIDKSLKINGTGARVILKRSSVQNTPLESVVAVTAGTVELNNLSITGGFANSLETPGGGGVNNSAQLVLRNCSIYSNRTIGAGGGVYNAGTLTVTNCTISNNSAGGAGGLYNKGNLTVIASTIAANNSDSDGQAIYTTGPAQVSNSVLTNSSGSPYTCVFGAFTSSGYNFISYLDGSTGFGAAHDQFGTKAFPADPELGALADNGGWTRTMLPASVSPLIDQGNSFGVTADERGFRRPLNNPGIVDAGDGADIGAVEADVAQTGPNFAVTTTDEHSDGLCGQGDCSLWDAANAADNNAANNSVITFAAGVRGTITTALQNVGINLTRPVSINGPGARLLTISGAGASRVFNVLSGGVSISGLTIAQGAFGGSGGGISNAGALTLTECAIFNNNALQSPSGALSKGGGIYNDAGASLTLNRCTFSANSAASAGGGLASLSSVTASNCTFAGNSAQTGAAISTNGSLTLVNCTIASNNAGSRSGGIDWLSGTAHLGNTIVAGNSANGPGPDLSGSFLSDGGNFIGKLDGSSGFTNGVNKDQVGSASLPKNPRLGALANNGGNTDTMTLLAGSMAIDAGNAAIAPPIDQRSVSRPQGGGVDIGAIEVAALAVEDTDRSIQYNGWIGFGSSSANGGFYRFSSVTNDTVTYKFTATSIRWITTKGPSMGKALVTIDGVSKGTFDLYRASTLWNQQILFSGLTDAAHTIVIKVTGTKNTSSTNYNVVVDGFLVGTATKPVQESAVPVQYNSWTGTKQTAASAGSYRSSGTLGAVAFFQFNGTAVTFITARGPAYGKVNVLIDGVLKSSNLDLYAPAQQWKYGLTYSGLSASPHTIEIRPAHAKNASSTGYNIVSDAFTGNFTPSQ